MGEADRKDVAAVAPRESEESALARRDDVKSADTNDEPQTKAEKGVPVVDAMKEGLVPHTGESTDVQRLQAELAVARVRLASSVQNLKEEVRENLDWQGYVRENPWKVVGVAFAVGFFIGSG